VPCQAVVIEQRAFPRAHPGGGSGNTSRKACMKLGGDFPHMKNKNKFHTANERMLPQE